MKLIAINQCIMRGTNIPTLTIGKEYEVIGREKADICIIDDQGEEHFFPYMELDKWFVIDDKDTRKIDFFVSISKIDQYLDDQSVILDEISEMLKQIKKQINGLV